MVKIEDLSSFDALVEAVESDEDTSVGVSKSWSWGPMQEGHATRLAEGLKTNNSLINLHLGFTHLGYEGSKVAKLLGEALKVNKTIIYLDIVNTYLSSSDAVFLANGLKENESINSLNIGTNELQDEGATAFAECLKANKVLRELDLSWCHITNKGASLIEESLNSNQSITKIDIHGNTIDSDILDKILKKVAVNYKNKHKYFASKTELGETLAKNGLARLSLAFFEARLYTNHQVKVHTGDELRQIGDITEEEIEQVKSICGYAAFETTPVGKLLASCRMSVYSKRFYKKGLREVKPLSRKKLGDLGVEDEEHLSLLYKLFNPPPAHT